MIAISQSGDKFYYLNWVPSESGLIITKYGNIKVNDLSLFKNKNELNQIFLHIISDIKADSPIFSLSVDQRNLIFSSSYIDVNNSELFDWYKGQTQDPNLNEEMDNYYYPMYKNSLKHLSISFPKFLRKMIKENIETLNAHLHNLNTGIFSAENGARAWFHASKLDSYLIWKFGKNKKDELLLIKENSLASYFSISRKNKKVNLNWQFGNDEEINNICEYINNLMKNKKKLNQPCDKIYVYSCIDKVEDLKKIQKQDERNIILLNPFSILDMIDSKKVNLYDTLPFAETGNAFGGIDV